jgi:hypothetical protein
MGIIHVIGVCLSLLLHQETITGSRGIARDVSSVALARKPKTPPPMTSAPFLKWEIGKKRGEST